jgi:hypothetical protein
MDDIEATRGAALVVVERVRGHAISTVSRQLDQCSWSVTARATPLKRRPAFAALTPARVPAARQRGFKVSAAGKPEKCPVWDMTMVGGGWLRRLAQTDGPAGYAARPPAGRLALGVA